MKLKNALKVFYLVIGSFAIIPATFSHGEDAPGPHGGHIRMPGPFHTELVLRGKDLQIFLLDINFMNPVTKNSEVTVRYQDSKNKVSPLICKSHGLSFLCALPKKFSAKAGTITVLAMRDNVWGQLVTYDLPLPGFKKSKAKTAPVKEKADPHAHH